MEIALLRIHFISGRFKLPSQNAIGSDAMNFLWRLHASQCKTSQQVWVLHDTDHHKYVLVVVRSMIVLHQSGRLLYHSLWKVATRITSSTSSGKSKAPFHNFTASWLLLAKPALFCSKTKSNHSSLLALQSRPLLIHWSCRMVGNCDHSNLREWLKLSIWDEWSVHGNCQAPATRTVSSWYEKDSVWRRNSCQFAYTAFVGQWSTPIGLTWWSRPKQTSWTCLPRLSPVVCLRSWNPVSLKFWLKYYLKDYTR